MSEKKAFKWFITLLVVIIIIVLLPCIEFNIDEKEVTVPLLKGYYWGGIVSGISAVIAFILVYKTFKFQQKVAQEQKEKLDKEIQEQSVYYQSQLKIAKENLEQQKRDNEIKQFEDVFYSMLEMQQNIVSNLSIELKFSTNLFGFKFKESKRIEGRTLFKSMFDEAYINVNNTQYKGVSDVLMKTRNIEIYGKIDKIYLFDHYFRHLYRIYKFLTDSKYDFLDEKSKDNLTDKRYEYSTIIRSTLSAYELIFLFINCLFMDSIKEHNFKKYAEKYALFDNLRDGNFQEIYDEFSGKYNDSALYSPKALLKKQQDNNPSHTS